MKRFLLLLSLLCIIGIKAQPNSPVQVEWISPTNGSVVSGTIQLSVLASSLVAPIHHVEFYRDGILIATVTNSMLANVPGNLRIIGGK